VDQVREPDSVLDEEDGDVVAHDVCPTLATSVHISLEHDIPKLPSSV
jgi:hypothetical protein